MRHPERPSWCCRPGRSRNPTVRSLAAKDAPSGFFKLLCRPALFKKVGVGLEVIRGAVSMRYCLQWRRPYHNWLPLGMLRRRLNSGLPGRKFRARRIEPAAARRCRPISTSRNPNRRRILTRRCRFPWKARLRIRQGHSFPSSGRPAGIPFRRPTRYQKEIGGPLRGGDAGVRMVEPAPVQRSILFQ